MNLVVSNVPGPPIPLYLAGAPLLEVFRLLPPMGNLTLVVAALSYAGQLNLTAAADQGQLPGRRSVHPRRPRRPRRPRPIGACARHLSRT